MLEIKRSEGEGIIIGDEATLRVWFVEGTAKLGFDGPAAVHRAELWLANKVKETNGVITPIMRSVIEDMEYHCPWRLKQVNLQTGEIVK